MNSSRVAQVEAIFEKVKGLFRKQKPTTVSSYRGRLKLLDCKPEAYPAHLIAASVRQDRQFRKTKGAMVWDLLQNLDRLREKWTDRSKVGDLRRAIGDRIIAVFGLFELIRAIKRAEPEAVTRAPKASKRLSLAGTPQDVDEQVAAKLRPCALPAGLVLMLTGCRPMELETGVTVTILPDGRLALEILGAKFTKKTGHETRVLTVSPRLSPLARQLRDLVLAAGGSMSIHRKRRRLGKDIQAAGTAAGFKGISPYSFRHLVASRLKSAVKRSKTLSPDQGKVVIAKMLGHIATATQAAYGTSRQGRGGHLALVGARASGVVRITHRPYPNGPGGVLAVSRKLQARQGAAQKSSEVKSGHSPFDIGDPGF